MSEISVCCTYFARPGSVNTDRTLDLVRSRAEATAIRTILVATTSGATGLLAAQRLQGFDVIVVTQSTGFRRPDLQLLTDENRAAIQGAGGRILTCQHAFGGVGRAVRKKLGSYQVDEIMAYTLRTFGEGMKVAAELCLMAADTGMVRTDEPLIAVGGSGGGADTAAILKPTNAQTFFDLRFLEIICMPSPLHPGISSTLS